MTLDDNAVQLRPRKVLALLAYLAVTLHRHTRDALADLLYPRQGRSRARAGIRQCLSILRGSLGREWIRTEGEAVRLDAGGALWVDVAEVRSPSRRGREGGRRRPGSTNA